MMEMGDENEILYDISGEFEGFEHWRRFGYKEDKFYFEGANVDVRCEMRDARVHLFGSA